MAARNARDVAVKRLVPGVVFWAAHAFAYLANQTISGPLVFQ